MEDDENVGHDFLMDDPDHYDNWVSHDRYTLLSPRHENPADDMTELVRCYTTLSNNQILPTQPACILPNLSNENHISNHDIGPEQNLNLGTGILNETPLNSSYIHHDSANDILSNDVSLMLHSNFISENIPITHDASRISNGEIILKLNTDICTTNNRILSSPILDTNFATPDISGEICGTQNTDIDQQPTFLRGMNIGLNCNSVGKTIQLHESPASDILQDGSELNLHVNTKHNDLIDAPSTSINDRTICDSGDGKMGHLRTTCDALIANNPSISTIPQSVQLLASNSYSPTYCLTNNVPAHIEKHSTIIDPVSEVTNLTSGVCREDVIKQTTDVHSINSSIPKLSPLTENVHRNMNNINQAIPKVISTFTDHITSHSNTNTNSDKVAINRCFKTQNNIDPIPNANKKDCSIKHTTIIENVNHVKSVNINNQNVNINIENVTINTENVNVNADNVNLKHQTVHLNAKNSAKQSTNNEFICPYKQCTEILTSEINLSRHILHFHIIVVYTCHICNRLFPLKHDLADHISTHSTDNTIDLNDHPAVNQNDQLNDHNPATDHTHAPAINHDQRIAPHFTSESTLNIPRHVELESSTKNDTTPTTNFVKTRSQKKSLNTRKQSPRTSKICYDFPDLKNGSGWFVCPHCEQSYPLIEALRTHVFYQHFDGVHDCLYYVDTQTGKRLSITWHDAQQFRCLQCFATFATNEHKEKHDLTQCVAQNIYRCSKCPRKFSTLNLVQIHEESQNCVIYVNSASDSPVITNGRSKSRRSCRNPQPIKSLLTKTHKCLYPGCVQRYRHNTRLRLHHTTHGDVIDEKSETCTMCHAAFRTRRQLRHHKLSHTKHNIFPCLYCDKRYKFLTTLKAHVVRSHFISFDKTPKFLYHREPTTLKEYHIQRSNDLTCKDCSASFASRSTYNRHCVDKHGKGKTYSCDDCNLTFPTLWCYVQHRDSKIHNSSRQHVCTTCDKPFHTKSALWSHQAVHKTEKPFQCSICGKTFTRQNQLKRHSLTHTTEKRHQCPTCGKLFSVIYDVKRHMLVHNAGRVKRYKCNLCEKSYDKKARYVKHCETIHANEMPIVA